MQPWRWFNEAGQRAGLQFSLGSVLAGCSTVPDQQDRPVSSYTYSDIQLCPDWDLQQMEKERRERLGQPVQGSKCLLVNRGIRFLVHLACSRPMLLPFLDCGGELFGTNGTLASRAQATVNKALLRVDGAGSAGLAAVATLWKDSELNPVHASRSAERVQAFCHWSHQSHLTIRPLIHHPPVKLRHRT